MRRLVTKCVCVCVLWIAPCCISTGGNAVFGQDGKSALVLNDVPDPTMDQIDATNGAVTRIQVQMGKDDVVEGIALATNGTFYLVTKHALWRWKQGTAKAHWIAPAPDGVELTDVACHPASGDVLIAAQTKTESRLYYRRHHSDHMTSVGIRYPPGKSLDCPVFLPDGSFLFSADGDLWHGFVEQTTEPSDSSGEWTRENLVAYRYAPMAARETDDVAPPETGILGIAGRWKKRYV